MARRPQEPDIFMWHHGRCGSSVVADLLNQHPDVYWRNEVFERFTKEQRASVPVDRELRALQWEAGRRRLGVELKGLPCQHPHFIHVDLNTFVDKLERHGFGKVIHLHRENLLLKLLSVQIVDQKLRTKFAAHSPASAKFDGKLTVDLQRVRILGRYAPLLDMIAYIEEHANAAKELLSKRFDTLSITYEQDIKADPKQGYRRMSDFLGLSPMEPSVRLQRINTKTLADLVANYDDVVNLLAPTEYAWMLDE